MKYTNWRVPAEAPLVPPALLEAGVTRLLSAILQLRGLSGAEEAQEFLSGGEETVSSPLELADMICAVQRLGQAIAAGEHVAVYGDYDVDGITAGCLLSHYLRSRGLCCELYVPDRLQEGYGLNTAAIDELKARGVTLIVTVDCGVTNLEECAYAASLGLDLIVTDHHECRRDENGQEILPEAEAVVDPKRSDNGPAGACLAGVGVAFKLVCAMDGNAERMLSRYGDLVAAGTVADVMLLRGENRYMVRRGLKMLAERSCRPGFTALAEEAGAGDKKLTAATIGYSLAPRINAAGRLGDASLAIRLLECTDQREASELARELCQKNRDRQEEERKIWADVQEQLRGRTVDAPLVLCSDKWHPGVIGIVASRLSDVYSVPAVMICMGENEDRYKGSCRSSGNFNLYEALGECSDCLVSFGGHAMAAGVSVKPDKIDELRERLGQYYRSHPGKTEPALDIDLRIEDPEMLSMECVESLDRLEPCGNGNPRPVLYLGNAALTQITPIGNEKHLRLRLNRFGQDFDCVFFSQTVRELGCRVGQQVDAVFSPQINEFRGKRTVQLVITDLREHRENAECGMRNSE